MAVGVVGALPRADNGKLRPYPTGRDPGPSGASVSKNVQAQQRQGNFSCRALPSYFLSLQLASSTICASSPAQHATLVQSLYYI
jgi:hypothetical protein